MTRPNLWIPCCTALVLASCGKAPVPKLTDSPQWLEAQKTQQFEDSGKALGRAQAEDVERHVAEDPDDVVGREKLLLFYAENGTRFYDPAFVIAARRRHILWMIEHHPDLPLMGERAGLINPPIDQIEDRAGYAQASKLWLAQAAKPDAPLAVVGNAAAFLSDTDKAEAEKLLQQAQARDPNGPWSTRLAVLNANGQPYTPADGSIEASAREAIASYEQGDQEGADKARKNAQDVLQQAPGLQGDPHAGTAVYQANMVLGLLAMREHDRKTAVKYLQEAANAPATDELAYSEQPVTYQLLSWLLKDGERDSVILFLTRFAKTSVVSRQQLLDSAGLIRKGQKPAWYPMEAQS